MGDTKICTICNLEKELSEFYSQKKTSKSKGEYTYYYPYCKKCAVKKSYKWNLENHDRYEHNRKTNYHQSEALRKRTARNKIKIKEYGKEWRKNNKDKFKEYSRKRESQKSHDISKDELRELYKYANHSCMYCGMSQDYHKHIYNQKLHKDHAMNYGSDKIDNCVLACKECNSRKGKKDWDKWYTSKNIIYSKEKYDKILQWLNIKSQ